MKKCALIIIGTGKTARNLYSFVTHHGLYEVIGFAVSEQYYSESEFMGKPVYRLERLSEDMSGREYSVFVALLWNRLNSERKGLYEYCKRSGMSMANIVSPTAVVRGNLLGDNCWIGDYVVVQGSVDIESDVFIRSCSVICHDSHIESHAFISAGVVVGGDSRIGEQSFVGLHATIADDVRIGSRCIVGASTFVNKHLPDCSKMTMLNVKHYDESEIESKLVKGYPKAIDERIN